MYMIVYVSDYFGDENIGDVLEDIVYQAANNNAKRNITGALFFHNGQFLQLLEGELSDLDALMAKILLDSRHKNIKIIKKEQIARRTIPYWSLKAFNITRGHIIDDRKLADFVEQFDSICNMEPALFLSYVSHLVKLKELTKPKS